MTSSLRSKARQALIVSLATFSIAGAGFVFAAPTAQPPGSAIPLPLHVGSAAQTKAGPLTVQGLLTASAGLTVAGTTTTGTLSASTVCIAGDCKTAWPAGGGGVATASGASYTGGNYCYLYNYYDQMSYYQYGSAYNNYVYNCGTQSYTGTFTSNIPAGSTPGAVISSTIWCHMGGSNYTGYTPASSYINDSYYPWRTQATVTSITNNNNGTINVTVSCKPTTGNNYSYTYPTIKIDSLSFTY